MATATAVHHNFIDGKWIEGADGVLEVRNPANHDEVVARFSKADVAQTRSALEAAQKAFPAWRATPPPQRARIVRKALQLVEERVEQIARDMVLEAGKVLSDARGEVLKGANLLEYYAGEGLRLMGDAAPSELAHNLLYTKREPLGVVSLITPWNFPWAIPCWKVSPALVAGNTVVFKPASFTPTSAYHLVKCFEDAGMPPGVLNLVVGSGSKVGNELITADRVCGISFTGSNEVGKGIERQASERGKKLCCELGGKNPCVVLEDADLDAALAGVLKGAFGAAGQRCTATSRLVLVEPIADRFVEKLVEATKKLRVGPGMDDDVDVGPVIDRSQLESILDLVEAGKNEGAALLAGGKRLTENGLDKGFFIAPTVFDQVDPDATIAQEELFGPVLSVIRAKDFDEAVSIANHTRYGLSSSVYTRDINRAMRFVDAIEAGMVHVNSPTLGGEAQVPFGGIKASGVGDREMAKEGLHFFTELKTVFLDYTGGARKSNIY